MSAVEASSVKVGTMADGTLRLTVDIEPRHAQDAFKLFGSPGTPIALAALKTAHAAQTDEGQWGSSQEPAEKPKGGELAKWCAMRCQEEEFWRFLNHHYGYGAEPIKSADEARAVVLYVCDVQSRAEFDADPAAGRRFRATIMASWQMWCLASGVNA